MYILTLVSARSSVLYAACGLAPAGKEVQLRFVTKEQRLQFVVVLVGPSERPKAFPTFAHFGRCIKSESESSRRVREGCQPNCEEPQLEWKISTPNIHFPLAQNCPITCSSVCVWIVCMGSSAVSRKTNIFLHFRSTVCFGSAYTFPLFHGVSCSSNEGHLRFKNEHMPDS